MLTRYALGYVLTGLSFALIDSIWLRTMYTRLYQPEIGELLGGLRLGPAIAFYLLYIGGMMWFAVGPALANGRWQTAWALCATPPMISPILPRSKSGA